MVVSRETTPEVTGGVMFMNERAKGRVERMDTHLLCLHLRTRLQYDDNLSLIMFVMRRDYTDISLR